MRHKKLFAFFTICMATLVYIAISIKTDMMPTIKKLCESRAQAIALAVSSEVIDNHMQEMQYDSLMNLNYNANGKLMTISANITEMNKMSMQIVSDIQAKLLRLENTVVEIPIGKLLGWSIFSGYGPKIYIKLIPAGNVQADFKTGFTAEGINQTKHTVYIDVNTAVTIIAPFTSDAINSRSVITVAETVIIGDIPETYLKMEEESILKAK